MNPARFALNRRTFLAILTLLLIGGGLLAFEHLGRLEDPTFTIKTALVITPYPGATPLEVEEEITEKVEEAIKSMGQVKEIYSTSQEGISFVYVEMKDAFNKRELPQIWDELRRKVADIQATLPPGAGPSQVNDDFGDVYGVFFALTGDNYTLAQLKDQAEYLKKELLLCKDVAKIDFWGIQQQVLYIEFEPSKLAGLGISPDLIYQTLHLQNVVESSGKVDVNTEYMRISPTGEFKSETMIADLLIGGAGSMVRLGDIATITRGYWEPPRNMMRYNGRPCIGIGVSTVDGGNVITMGDSVREKLHELEARQPPGMALNTIYYQSRVVTESVNAFLINLAEAVVIVVVLLMIFMGWQSGMLIGIILLLTILGTFMGMLLMGIDLQKISLGALILALGMLVDNAIVVTDGILVRVTRGESRESAAVQVVRENQWPLLGATFVAILAFAAIGYAPGNVGEFCRSLFQVMALSLLLSWLFAVTITPLFCVWFLKTPESQAMKDPYGSRIFRIYRRMLHLALRWRYLTLVVVSLLMLLSIIGFGSIPSAFFPDSTQRYFYVNFWKSQGTHINHTADDLAKIEQFVRQMDGVKNITTFAGEGALRFLLSYDYQIPNPSYGQLLVEVDDYLQINGLVKQVNAYLAANFPDAEPYARKIVSGPPVTFQVEARFRGPDIKVLQDLADQAGKIMEQTPNTRDVRTDWRQQVRVIRPEFSQSQARRSGVTRSEFSSALKWQFTGVVAGLYREGDELIPIITRPPEKQRNSVGDLDNVQIYSHANRLFIPINQVITGVKTVWEWPLIGHRDQQRAVTVQCNPARGLAAPLRLAMAQKIEALDLPPGYSLEWAGEFEASNDAREPLGKIFPLCVLGMFVIVVGLFNSVRTPLVIFLTVPLSIMGIAAGLLIMDLPFGFMAILGFLGLSGMLIKNAIVLIEQVEIFLKEDYPPYKAILDSSVSRMRPVIMASGTTILGMLPLVFDPMFATMAVTIMGGLFVATFLTLIVVPLLYCLFYRIKSEKRYL
ncbi:MdtC [Desulforapulum autotrophicum HRM2]|uniref:MdtC n=1 Tax=Desulforapulum autotrophicum (strain ATCC 43914 / DSM 3382 / VKM B-1955 / HRM2) TaxID=177437 RepID=C0QMG3_DESAH|nr:efflux RND transporter permease subunit [Desulforapulum autotrophicum]ACN16480.1 MdtC [Desulforapulum autotrophicum HRM2]